MLFLYRIFVKIFYNNTEYSIIIIEYFNANSVN